MQVTGSFERYGQKWCLVTILAILLPFDALSAQSLTSVSDASESTTLNNHSIDSAELKPLWGGPISFETTEAIGLSKASPTGPSVTLHHFDLACERCHKGSVSVNETDFVMSQLNSDVDINASCTLSGCHTYNAILNHPIDISPTTLVPEGLRLDSFNRITCLTCHYQQGLSYENNSPDRSLQIPEGMEFCASCHSTMSGTSTARSHWQFSSMAHLESIGPNAASHNIDLPSGLLDTESQRCLSCHERINATISGDIGTSRHSGRSDMMANHPIGMDYSNVVSRNALRYNHLSSVNLDIRLFDGKMGCGSCHSLYSKLKKNLVQDNTGSRLCFECHNM